jgi:hypothetical protein
MDIKIVGSLIVFGWSWVRILSQPVLLEVLCICNQQRWARKFSFSIRKWQIHKFLGTFRLSKFANFFGFHVRQSRTAFLCLIRKSKISNIFRCASSLISNPQFLYQRTERMKHLFQNIHGKTTYNFAAGLFGRIFSFRKNFKNLFCKE